MLPMGSSAKKVNIMSRECTPAARALAEISRSVWGTLVHYKGIGVLIQGESGSGKTFCGLEIVLRGGRLVSDDIVEIIKTPGGQLIGWSREETKGLIEIKGIGLVHIGRLLGDYSILAEGPINMVITFSQESNEKRDHRKGILGLMGIDLPYYRLENGQAIKAVEFIEELAEKGNGHEKHSRGDHLRSFGFRKEHNPQSA